MIRSLIVALLLVATTASAQPIGQRVTPPRFFGSLPLGAALTVRASDGDTLTISLDGTNATVASNNGDLNLSASTGFVAIPSTVGSITQRFFIRSSATGQAGFELGESSTSTLFMRALALENEARLFVADAVENNLMLLNAACTAGDYAHGLQTNPTLFVHSDACPAASTTQWIGSTHNGTDPVISWGLGMLTLAGPAGDESVRLPVIEAAVPTQPHACDASHTGAIVYIDDTNDLAAAQLCYCQSTNDTVFDWVNVTSGAACTFI